MPLIAFLEDRSEQAGYLLSLADANNVPHDQIVRTDDGWVVPQAVYDAYTAEDAPTAVATSGAFQVVYAGTDLSTPRPANAAAVYWKFAAGVDTGVDNADIVNALSGDQVFVASA